MAEKFNAPFITFEGGEGAGKSTQVEILATFLRNKGIIVETVREPGGTPGAEQIRDILLKGRTDRWDPITEALLMSAARRDLLIKRIKPHLAEGTWIICDRHFDSTTAYQGFGHQIGYDEIRELNQFTVGTFQPDLTFIIDIPPQVGIDRTAGRTLGEDRFERMNMDFHNRVMEGFQTVAIHNPDRCVVVNGLQDVDILAKELQAITLRHLKGFFENYREA